MTSIFANCGPITVKRNSKPGMFCSNVIKKQDGNDHDAKLRPQNTDVFDTAVLV